MEIRKATQSDIPVLDKILYQAATRIKAKNSKQWSHVLLGEEKETLINWVEKGYVYVGVTSEIIAMCYLYPDDLKTSWDDLLWSNQQPEKKSRYLHKLALEDKAVGQGLAQKFLQQLQTFIFETEQVSEIRLDCMSEKNVLNRLYDRSGFDYLTTIPKVNTGQFMAPFNLYRWQKKIAK